MTTIPCPICAYNFLECPHSKEEMRAFIARPFTTITQSTPEQPIIGAIDDG